MEEQTGEQIRVIRSNNMDEFVAAVCKRPGMYVRQNKLDKVACFFFGYDTAYFNAAQEGEPLLETSHKWRGDFTAFSIWLCEECFWNIYGDAVGSAAGWAYFLSCLAKDDAGAFIFLPVLSLMRNAAEAARDGEERPLLAHVAVQRTFRAEQKARALALLEKAENPAIQ